jgi:hypothetical protein
LTGHTDEHWKAVRKSVAPAFSAGNMRCAPAANLEIPASFTEYIPLKPQPRIIEQLQIAVGVVGS